MFKARMSIFIAAIGICLGLVAYVSAEPMTTFVNVECGGGIVTVKVDASRAADSIKHVTVYLYERNTEIDCISDTSAVASRVIFDQEYLGTDTAMVWNSGNSIQCLLGKWYRAKLFVRYQTNDTLYNLTAWSLCCQCRDSIPMIGSRGRLVLVGGLAVTGVAVLGGLTWRRRRHRTI